MTRALRRTLVRLRGERGTNLVEAAFLTPLLLLVSFSIIEFGMLFFVYLALENGVSQASRYAVTGQLAAGLSREQSIIKAMRDATPSLTIPNEAFTFTHLPVDATPGTAWLPGSGGPNDIGKVTVNYTWPLYTPLVRPFFTGGQITFVVESAMKNEQYEEAE
jgi:Flp pilus assembly protein TadG